MNENLRKIVDTIGMRPATELCRVWGGRLLYVPPEMLETHPIALTIGFIAATRLAEAVSNEQVSVIGGLRRQIEVPAERNVLLELRNEQICAGYKAKTSVSELAETYGISRKMIMKVLDRAGLREAAAPA